MKRKRVIFIEPKPPSEHVFSKYKIPRLGSVLLGTLLRQKGYDAEVCIEEWSGLNWKDIQRADIVGISTLTSTAPRAYQIADRLRRAGKLVIMGGPHPTFAPEEALKHCDYVLRGECESAIFPLMAALEGDLAFKDVPNLTYRREGEIQHNPQAPFIQDLDEIPIPDYSLVQGWQRERPVISIATSRGCPHDCSFCSVIGMFGRGYRFNSVERVIEELRQHIKHVKHVFFCDDNFTARPERTKELLRRMLEENLLIDWGAQVRVEAARDEEMLELMARTKCFSVYVGLESVNPKTLELYNKHQTVDDITNCVKAFQRHGIHVHGMFVLGSDEDDVKTIRETEQYARRTRIDSVQFLILTPIPGTRLHQQLESEGRIFNRDWSDYDGANAVYEPKRMTAYELQYEAFQAMDRFYTFSSVARYIFKLDLYYTIVRLYAIRMVSRGKRLKRAYLNQLRGMVRERLKTIKELPFPMRRIKRIALPSSLLDKPHETFLSVFLKELGLRVVVLKEKMRLPVEAGKQLEQNVRAQVAELHKRWDCVLLPYLHEVRAQVSEALQERKREAVTLARQLKGMNLQSLLLEIDPAAFKKSCVEIGLALNRNLTEIQKALLRAERICKISS
jgi:radical SAM superfamily enzyme YgiQ (UPF0313 family)